MNRHKVRKFPSIVKSGPWIVKVCGDRKPSGTDCRVVYDLEGKPRRLSVGNLDAARTEAAAKAAQLTRGELGRGSVNQERSMIHGQARESVRPFGALLDTAAIAYADAKIVPGAHLSIEAARFSMRHHGKGIAAKPMAKAGIEFARSKANAGRSELHLKDIAYRLRPFAKAFQCDVRQLVPQKVSAFVTDLKLSPGSFNHVHLLWTFFRFCQARAWLSRDTGLLGGVELRRDTLRDLEINGKIARYSRQ